MRNLQTSLVTRFVIRLLAVSCTMTPALAHPGHGDPAAPEGMLHYASSPVHYVPWLMVALGLGVMVMMAVKKRRQQACRATIPAKARPDAS